MRGEYSFTAEEELGRVLFFSNQFTNCSKCHQLKPLGGAEGETFSNYEFHNIGVPANAELRAVNGVPRGHVDSGLLGNPAVEAIRPKEASSRRPTLRNVAVTGPYMHNGVFKDLRTVILFYNKYNAKAARRQINPETGKAGISEVDGTLSLEELTFGRP